MHGAIDPVTGMVTDLGVLDRLVQETVISRYNCQDLRQVAAGEVVNGEDLAQRIWHALAPRSRRAAFSASTSSNLAIFHSIVAAKPLSSSEDPMPRLACSVTIGLVFWATASKAAGDEEAIEKELLAEAKSSATFVETRDKEAVLKLYTADYSGVQDGEVETRETIEKWLSEYGSALEQGSRVHFLVPSQTSTPIYLARPRGLPTTMYCEREKTAKSTPKSGRVHEHPPQREFRLAPFDTSTVRKRNRRDWSGRSPLTSALAVGYTEQSDLLEEVI